MNTYYTASSHASKPYFFDRNHKISASQVDFDYDKKTNPDGVYSQCVVDADSEFQAGIEFVKLSFPADSLAELIDMAIENIGDCGDIPQDLADLIDELNDFLPPEHQKHEGKDFGIE